MPARPRPVGLFLLAGLLAFSLTAVVVAVTASSAQAAGPSVRQVTNDSLDDLSPSLGGGRLVWQSWDGGDWDIELLDLSTGATTPVTSSEFGVNDERPQIDESGASVVFGTRNRTEPTMWTLRLYDVFSGTTEQIATVDDGGYDGWQPRVDSGLVVWWGIEVGVRYVYVRSVSAGRETLRLGGADAYGPVVSYPYVCWIESGGVYAFDDRTGVTRRLESLGGDPPAMLALSGPMVLATWVDGDAGNARLVSCDLLTDAVQDIAVGEILDRPPVLSEGRVAWADETGVWTADVATGVSARVADSPGGTYAGGRQFALSGDTLAWTVQGYDPSAWAIYRHDLATGATTLLSERLPLGHNQAPTVWGDLIAWQGKDATDAEIFLYSPGAFNDVACSPYRYAAESLALDGIVSGYPDGSFRPNALVVRAQFAKMIVGALDIAVTEGGEPLPFTDVEVDPGDLYPDDYVAAAAALGITQGVTSTTFAPFRAISRAQVVTMVVRAAGARGLELVTPPADWSGSYIPADPTHGSNMAIAEYNGLLDDVVLWEDVPGSGESPVWDPWAEADRGEVAQILWNLRGRPIGGLGAPGMPAGLEEWLRRRGFLGTVYTLNSLPEGWFASSDPLTWNEGASDYFRPHNPAYEDYGSGPGYDLSLTRGSLYAEASFGAAFVSAEELSGLPQGDPTGVYTEGREWTSQVGQMDWLCSVTIPLPEDPERSCLLRLALPYPGSQDERTLLLEEFARLVVKHGPAGD